MEEVDLDEVVDRLDDSHEVVVEVDEVVVGKKDLSKVSLYATPNKQKTTA